MYYIPYYILCIVNPTIHPLLPLLYMNITHTIQTHQLHTRCREMSDISGNEFNPIISIIPYK